MRFSAATLLVTALGWASAATAHTIQLKAHSRECFHEALHKDDLMTVTFQVGDREFGGSGNLDIDFWVCLPPCFAAPVQLQVLARETSQKNVATRGKKQGRLERKREQKKKKRQWSELQR